jgi:hypothetical protein
MTTKKHRQTRLNSTRTIETKEKPRTPADQKINQKKDINKNNQPLRQHTPPPPLLFLRATTATVTANTRSSIRLFTSCNTRLRHSLQKPAYSPYP